MNEQFLLVVPGLALGACALLLLLRLWNGQHMTNSLKVQHGAFSNQRLRILLDTVAPLTVARKARDVSLGTEAAQPLDETQKGDSRKALGAAEAAAYGAWALADITYDWAQIDPSVFVGASNLTGEQISSAPELAHLLAERGYDFGSSGFHNMLRGHAGEPIAFNDLASSGQVWAPDQSNFPGMDGTLDGHPFNVKVTADFTQTANDHFAENPDTALVVNADAANLPDDAVHFDFAHPIDPSVLVGDHVTVVDDALSMHQLDASVSNGLDGMVGDALTGPGFPIISALIAVARSSVREGRLLNEGATDWSRATKNVVLDAAGGGGGAWAGAVAGFHGGLAVDAMAGGTTFGAGALLGAVIGAIGGGIAGKRIAKELRQWPLRDARTELDRALEQYESKLSLLTKQANASWNIEFMAAEARFKESNDRALTELNAIRDKHAASVRAAKIISEQQAMTLVGETKRELFARTPRPHNRFTQWWSRPSQKAFGEGLAAWHTEIRSVLVSESDGATVPAEDLFDLLAISTAGVNAAGKYTKNLFEAEFQAAKEVDEATRKTRDDISLRHEKAEEELASRYDTITSNAKAELDPTADHLAAARDRYQHEFFAAGFANAKT